MNDEQRQIAVGSLQEDIENLRKYNVRYEEELKKINEAIMELENQKVGPVNQIRHNNALIDALDAAIGVIQL